MRNGFTFNGKHTSEFGNMTVKTKDRPIFPAIKEAVYSAAEMNGEYDFSEVSGHEYFETRKFQVDLQVSAENLEHLQKKVSSVSKWLKGRGSGSMSIK